MIQPMYNGSAQVTMLPYAKQLIIEAKIPLFELEKYSAARLDSNDYGYVNCKAIKNDRSTNLPIQIIWYAGNKGYVRYSRDQNGRYLGYCPDDVNWYNRVKLCSSIQNSKVFKISKYINEDGLITVGSEITEEINFINNEIFDWVAKVGKNVVARSKNYQEVNVYVETKRAEGTPIQGPMRGLIEELDIVHQIHKNDWIFSPQFQEKKKIEIQDKLKNRYKNKIKEIEKSQPDIQAVVTKMVPNILKSMSLKQLTEIVKQRVRDECKGNVITPDGKLLSDGVPLEKLTINKIRTVAVEEFGIKTQGKTREELIAIINKKILEAAEDEPEDVNDVLGPPTQEEIKNRENAGLPPLETVEKI